MFKNICVNPHGGVPGRPIGHGQIFSSLIDDGIKRILQAKHPGENCWGLCLLVPRQMHAEKSVSDQLMRASD